MTATLPANHVAARRALAEAVRIDEVKDIRNKAVAMQVYAKQAKDGVLIAHATEIRKRAERRLGEIIESERKAGKLAKGAREKGVGRRGTRVIEKPALSLADRGIDKNLADRARKMAALPEARSRWSSRRRPRSLVTSEAVLRSAALKCARHAVWEIGERIGCRFADGLARAS